MTLVTDRAAKEAALAALRRERGAAHLDGRAFDDGTIDRIEHEIDALGEAEAEAARRERETAAAELSRRRDQLRDDMEAAEVGRLAAVGRAESAARDLAKALGEALAAALVVEREAVQAGEKPSPLTSGTALEKRLSGYLSAVLGDIAGAGARFGHLDLKRSIYRHETDWTESERATRTIRFIRNYAGENNGNHEDRRRQG